MEERVRILFAAFGLIIVAALPSPAWAAAPRIIMVYGESLPQPIVLTG